MKQEGYRIYGVDGDAGAGAPASVPPMPVKICVVVLLSRLRAWRLNDLK
jgi:hypothetical protein